MPQYEFDMHTHTANTSSALVRKRIALDYDKAGVGHPSTLNLWFTVVDGTSPGQRPIIDADNTSVAVLESLPGFTAAMAKDVYENARIYTSVEDLAKTYHIAPYNMEILKRTLFFSSSGATAPESPMVPPADSEGAHPDTPDVEQPHYNLHSMTFEQLVAINGIGRKSAERLIAYRSKKLITGEDSLKEAGLNQNVINKIKGKVCF